MNAGQTNLEEISNGFHCNLSENIVASDKIFKTFQYLKYEKKLTETWKIFTENSIEILVIKGWAAAANYPEPWNRPLGDIDFAVKPEDYPRALEIKESFNLSIVDLHCGLRSLDTVNWDELYERAESVQCMESAIFVLSSEDHLRVLCNHWLIDGGINREKLWDIYFAVAIRPKNFDWEKCLGAVSSTRQKWIIYTIGLAHKYLALDIEDIPFKQEAKNIPAWLIKTLEKEWESNVKFQYLDSCLDDPLQFFHQLKKRFPPNSIQATIMSEGEFDDKSRFPFQVRYLWQRTVPTICRLVQTIFQKYMKKHTNTK